MKIPSKGWEERLKSKFGIWPGAAKEVVTQHEPHRNHMVYAKDYTKVGKLVLAR